MAEFADMFEPISVPVLTEEPPPPDTPADTLSDGQKQRTALLGTVADKSSPEDSFETLLAKNRAMLDNGQEDLLRRRISNQKLELESGVLRDMQESSIRDGDSSSASLYLQREAGLRAQKGDLEAAGIAAIQNKAGSDPHTQSAIDLALEDGKGEQYDIIQSNLVKGELLNREIDKLEQILKHESPFSKFVETGASFVGAFLDILPLTGMAATLDVDKLRGSGSGKLLPAQSVQTDLDYLFSPLTSAKEFAEYLPGMMERMRIAALGNPQAVLAGLHQLQTYNNRDVWGSTTMTALAVGPGALLKSAQLVKNFARLARKSPLKLASMAGNTDMASDLAAEAILKDSGKGLEVPGSKSGATQADALEELLPSSVSKGNGKPWIGNPGQVQKKLDKIVAARAEVDAIGRAADDVSLPSRFVDDAQEAKSIEQAIDDVLANNAERGLPILDTRRIGPHPEPVPAAAAAPNAKASSSSPAPLKSAPIPLKVGAERFKETVSIHGVDYPIFSPKGVEIVSGKSGMAPKEIWNLLKEANAKRIAAAKAITNVPPPGPAVTAASPPAKSVGSVTLPGEKQAFSVSKQADTSLNELTFYVGPKSGDTGFLTEASAKTSMSKMGLTGRIVETIDGKFAIETKHIVTETGVVSTNLDPKNFTTTNLVSRFLKSADNITIDEFGGARALSVAAKNKLENQVLKPLAKKLKALFPHERDILTTVVNHAQTAGKDYNETELAVAYTRVAGRMPSQKEAGAYFALIKGNRLTHRINNREIYTSLARNGELTIRVRAKGIDSGARNGRIIDNFDPTVTRYFDAETGKYHAAGKSPDYASKMATGEYKIVKFTGEKPVLAGERATYVLTARRNLTTGPLNPQQIPYIPGGPSKYKGNVFSKQANIGKHADGSKWYDNPNTHVVGETRKDVDVSTKEMNAGLKAYRDLQAGKLSPAKAAEILEQTPFQNVAKMDKLIKEGKLNTHHDFETLYDNQRPSQYDSMDPNHFRGDELTGEAEWYNTRGLTYYSSKTDGVLSPQQQPARTISAFELMQKGLNHAIQMRSFNSGNIMQIEEWVRQARPYLKPEKGMSNFDLFQRGTFLPAKAEKEAGVVGTLESQRAVVKRFLSTRTPMQEKLSLAGRDLGEMFMDIPGVGRPLRNAGSWIADKNPSQALTALIFDAHLGFYNPAQLFMQVQQSVMAATMSPKWGLRALADVPMFSRWLADGSDELLDVLAKRNAGHGFHPEDYKKMAKAYKELGHNAPVSDQNLFENYSGSAGGGYLAAAGEQVQKVRQGGRVFYNKPEQMNRQVAWKIAWQKVSELHPEMSKDSTKFKGLVRLHAHDFEGGLGKGSAAFWQTGFMKPVTQFMGWQFRTIESVLPKVAGGNKRLTAGNKIGMAIGHVFLHGAYGAAGVSLGGGIKSVASSLKQMATGEDLTDTEFRIITKGFWDTLITGTINSLGGDVDTDFSNRSGWGAGIENYIRKLSDPDKGQTFLDAIGGTALNEVVDFGTGVTSALWDITAFAVAGRTGELPAYAWDRSVQAIAEQVTTFSNALKADIIWRTGEIRGKDGRPLIDGVDRTQAFLTMLGIPDRRETQLWNDMHDQMDEGKTISEMATKVAKLKVKAMDALERGDAKEAEKQQAVITGLLQFYPDLRSKIWAQAGEKADFDSKWTERATKHVIEKGKALDGERSE